MLSQATQAWRHLVWMLGIGLLCPALLQAQSFTVSINLSDGVIAQPLVLGMHPSASDGYDAGLDEGAPPFPFPGIFQAQILNTEVTLSPGFYTEFRAVDPGAVAFMIRYQRGSGQPDITVSWDPASLPNGRNLTIVDTSQPPTVGQDMKQTGTMVINSSENSALFNELLIQVSAATNLPVELVSFSAALQETAVELAWETLTETNNAGFYVERAADGLAFTTLAFVDGHGSTQRPQAYQYTDRSFQRGTPLLQYRLKQVDFDGTFSYSPVITVDAGASQGFRLDPAYPNPATDRSYIGYALEDREPVTLTLYDALGRQIRTLVQETQRAGWYRVPLDTAALPNGLYVYHLKTPTYTQTRSLMVAR